MVLLRSRPSTIPSSSSTEHLMTESTRPSTDIPYPCVAETQSLEEERQRPEEERLKLEAEVVEKFDPNGEAPALWPMSEHRKMVGTMMLDNMLYATARLQKHWWVLGSRNEEFGDSEFSPSSSLLCGLERWEAIHEDLLRYSKAVNAYDTWKTSFISTLELEHQSLPPTFQTYGRTLALLECALQKTDDPTTLEILKNLSRRLVASHTAWSQTSISARTDRFHGRKQGVQKRALARRMVMASFAGSMMIAPMLIMVLHRGLYTKLFVTGFFTLGVGLVLAWWMEEGDSRDVMAATAAYAAVLVVFVGTGT
ncbi:uncharacterized protein PAC_11456 [Phialocephala subalpina]|uniref:DUF6594 domain-containing protein n=1 Tax=Phialocephala subalpina TaxID=576137 RepID=A0A1L7X957_9HELO|nr:uncharacterized protein PAC_11456 [Phialocephala subalpina]